MRLIKVIDRVLCLYLSLFVLLFLSDRRVESPGLEAERGGSGEAVGRSEHAQ